MTRLFIIILFTALCALQGFAQAIDTHTRVFDSRFKTLQVKLSGNDYFPPIMVLGSDDRISIAFDELAEDRRYLRYSVTHCNADWQPSDLVETEYVDGFNYANIEDYKFSSATFCHYVHYSFTVPNENMNFSKSGNYLVKIYSEDEPETTLLQARFCISENAVSILPSISSRTDIDYNREHQQLTAEIATKNYTVQNMYKDVKLYVSQNSRIDNEVMVDEPMMAGMGKITFEHNKALIFAAGNEYRRIETVAEHGLSMGVVRVEYYEPYYHALLRTDVPRARESYIYDKTQLGHFTIRSVDAINSDYNADYYITHFTLNTGGEITGGKIYLEGEFTNHLFTPESLMKYDSSTGCYTADMMLKQGAYNYQYLFVPDGTSSGLTSAIEGDKYQTVNEYWLRAYNRRPGERYDRLIGFGIIYSGK